MKTKRIASLARYVLIPIVYLTSLQPPLDAQQVINPTFLSLIDGIASADVRDVMQDGYGFIWIATQNGLQKYDGYKLESFKNDPNDENSLIDNNIWELMEDPDHNIWAATTEGISKYDQKTKTFTNYDLGNWAFNIFMDSKQNLWTSTNTAGFFHYNPREDNWEQVKYKPNDTLSAIQFITPVASITEDFHGTLWVNSIFSYGLIYKTKTDSVFRPAQFKDINYVPFIDDDNYISALYADSTGIIWITSKEGIHKYDPDTGELKTLKTYDYRLSEEENHHNHIDQDQEGNIWITNNFKGLIKFDGISDNFEEVLIAGNRKLPNQGWSITLHRFMVDKSGIFWFTSNNSGILKYDPAKNPFEHFVHDESNKLSLGDNNIFGLKASAVNPGLLYVGTRYSGLDVMDVKKEIFYHFTYQAVNDIYGGSVRSIGEKEDGTLLLGTWGDGLIELDKNYREVKRYTNTPHSGTSISNNRVRIIERDLVGNFWVGTNSGLNYFNIKEGTFTKIKDKYHRTIVPELINQTKLLASSDYVVAEIDKVADDQNLSKPFNIEASGFYMVEVVGEGNPDMADFGWIENERGDTIWNSFDPDNSYHAGGANKNRHFIGQIKLKPGSYTLHYHSDDSHSFNAWNDEAPDITSLYGILLMKVPDQKTSQIIDDLLLKSDEQQLLIGSNITAVVVRDKYIWVGTSEGMDKIDLEQNTIHHWFNDPYNPNSLGSDNISDLCEDESGIVWIATDKGITRFDPENNRFTRYMENDGLSTNYTESILPGDKGEMWIATQNGLSKMVINQELGKVTFINFNALDGLGGNSFTQLVAARTADGKFWFGGQHGLNSVSTLNVNEIPPEIVISDLHISNKSIYSTEYESLLTVNLPELKEIKLSYDQNNLSFEFAALHYANPSKNQYVHRLEGYDEEWIYDNRNYASYTNLAPGEYDLIVRASNAYGIWNEEGKTLHIIISPPWWKTWWAYGVYMLLMVLFIFSIIRITRSIILRKEQEKIKAKELAHAKEIELAYKKLERAHENLKATQSQLIQSEKMASLGELTAGIAHEIQNPLNFVNNFSEVSTEMIDEVRQVWEGGDPDEVQAILDDLKGNLEKISHHGQRASSIVKGMLEHSRAGSGEKIETDINSLCDEYLRLAYHGMRAKDRTFNADLETAFDDTLPRAKVVPQDIGRVLLNLINNAFQACADLSVSAGDGPQKANGEKQKAPLVTVSTKALGDMIEITVSDNGPGIPGDIKDKIFQPFFTTRPTGQGTGLGLSLSYDIVKAHGGTIEVENLEGSGTKMTIKIPVQ